MRTASMRNGSLRALALDGVDRLEAGDPELFSLLEREYLRQQDTLAMIASSSLADVSVLACESTPASNVTTEGYPGRRYHAGCAVIDDIERLAIARAKELFGADYANVQPHSGTGANQIVMTALLRPGDTVLGLRLDAGGHLTHGATASFSGTYFTGIGYGLDEHGFIDYAEVAELARTHRPTLIICGASAYPRLIDFERFRAIADEVGAYLLADISHIAGLVVGGRHPSPVRVAHFTTTSTYKQLFGPRGGLILMGPDANAPSPGRGKTLAGMLQHGAFPYFQGTPRINTIAAKARAFAMAATPQFRDLTGRIQDDAAALAAALQRCGWAIRTGGTDNHIVLVDVAARGLTGAIAERAAESCGIVVNRNKLDRDGYSALVTGGVRLGTNSLAARGMGVREMAECAALTDQVWSATEPISETEYHLDPEIRSEAEQAVLSLCKRFPLPAELFG
ncbi:serine hydroxymethyltransferase [Nocardia acidivorans]|uniref:serine hydroxymethyltransferase n=1 Tax=Nocardia acidivorans TaxID=404580 RepID=UPI000B327DE5|nr:serine hydroxymethyltransferase [Nocardia acidivorans]